MRRLAVYPAAALLLLAAGLKAHQLASSPAAANYVLQSRALTVALIIWEVALAGWLLSPLAGRAARFTAIGFFAALLGVSLWKALAGEVNCGCFGDVRVHPWVTTLVDAMCLAGMFVWMPRTWARHDQPRRRLVLIGAGTLALVLAMLIPVFSLRTSLLNQRGVIEGQGGLVVLEPEAWIGFRLPLSGYIDDGGHLLRGRWRIIFYHEDCPKCQEMIDQALAEPGELPTTFVEVPPLAAPQRADSEQLRWRHLTTQYEWFIESPAVVDVLDGVVTSAETVQR